MDIKDIRSFMECYNARSINKAAKSLYITPQGLGKIIDRIEHELQIRLFIRTAKGLEPTEAGIFFYGKSQKIINYMNEIETGFESMRENKYSLRIGYSCGLFRTRKSHEIEQFEKSNPELAISCEEDTNSSIKNKLLKGMLDIAFIIGRTASKDIIETEFFSRGVCAIVKRDDSLCSLQSMSVADLKDRQLITLNENYQLYSNLIASCEKEGFRPDIRIKTMEAAIIYSFVSDGLGVGIDAAIHERETIPSDLALIPVTDFIPWTSYIAYSKDNESNPWIKRYLNSCL